MKANLQCIPTVRWMYPYKVGEFAPEYTKINLHFTHLIYHNTLHFSLSLLHEITLNSRTHPLAQPISSKTNNGIKGITQMFDYIQGPEFQLRPDTGTQIVMVNFLSDDSDITNTLQDCFFSVNSSLVSVCGRN
jgi:hypothetical protein